MNIPSSSLYRYPIYYANTLVIHSSQQKLYVFKIKFVKFIVLLPPFRMYLCLIGVGRVVRIHRTTRYRHTQLVPVHYYQTTCPTLEIQIKYAYRNMTLSYIPNNPDELSGVYRRLVRCTVGHTVRLSWTTSSAAGHVVRPESNTSTYGTEEVFDNRTYLL